MMWHYEWDDFVNVQIQKKTQKTYVSLKNNNVYNCRIYGG